MNAKHMKQIAHKVRVSARKQQRNDFFADLFHSISSSAKDGNDYLIYESGLVPAKYIDILERLGYEISMNNGVLYISWN